jgi:hypothetical protein
MSKEPKLAEVAARISAHLKRFEADPTINAPRPRHGDTRRYYHTNTRVAGARVAVTYITYQGASNLTKSEALAYLVWLDAGNVGRHYEQQREKEQD